MKFHISSTKMHKRVIFNEIIDLCITSYSARPGLKPDTSVLQVQRSTDVAMPLHVKYCDK